MTGIRACRTTVSINDLPPRGMIRSMYSSISASRRTASRSAWPMSWMQSTGNPADAAPARKAAAMARFERRASLPPRRIVALPVFVQSTAASLVTFGRDS